MSTVGQNTVPVFPFIHMSIKYLPVLVVKHLFLDVKTFDLNRYTVHYLLHNLLLQLHNEMYSHHLAMAVLFSDHLIQKCM